MVSPLMFKNDAPGMYKISISGSSLWPPIVAYTPESFTIETHANFQRRLGAGLNSMLPGGLGGAASAMQSANGISLVTKKMTLLTWESSDPLTFSLPFLFNAQANALSEVHAPLARLLSLTLPSETDAPLSGDASNALGGAANAAGGMASEMTNTFVGQKLLRGPGPTFAEPNRNCFLLTVGNVAIFKDMVVTSVNVEMDSLVEANGHIISAKADVTMQSSTVYLKEDLLQAIRM